MKANFFLEGREHNNHRAGRTDKEICSVSVCYETREKKEGNGEHLLIKIATRFVSVRQDMSRECIVVYARPLHPNHVSLLRSRP